MAEKPKRLKHEDRVRALEDQVRTLEGAVKELGEIAKWHCEHVGGEIVYRDGKMVTFLFPTGAEKKSSWWQFWR